MEQIMFKNLQELITLSEARVLEPLRKVKEPGWYVVDSVDRPVEGPMQEGAAKDRAEELSGKVTGDIPAYEAAYYSDYDIRRMNECMIDDVQEPGWYASDANTGEVVEGPVAKKADLTSAVRDAEGGAINITQITAGDLHESSGMKAGVVNILMTALHSTEKPIRSALEQAYDAGFRDAGGEIKEGLNEGFMDFSVNGSDSASDLHFTALQATEKALRAGLKDKGNAYNTHGTLNVAMILVQKFGHDLSHGPLHDLAKDVLSKLTSEINAQEAKDKDNGRVEGDYLRAMKSHAKKLALAVK